MADNSYKILIVEDNEDQMALLENIVSKIDYSGVDIEIHKGSNYDEAVGIIKKSYPDLILLDVILVGLSGLYVAAYIAAYAINNHLRKPKIVFISGDTERKDDIKDKANYLEATFMWKPFDINALMKLVIQFIQNKFENEKCLEEQHKNKAILSLKSEEVNIIRALEHHVAHIIMEMQFFRSKTKQMNLREDEKRFLDEMSEVESKTISIFEQFKNIFR